MIIIITIITIIKQKPTEKEKEGGTFDCGEVDEADLAEPDLGDDGEAVGLALALLEVLGLLGLAQQHQVVEQPHPHLSSRQALSVINDCKTIIITNAY
jgi:hypothetical protein